jgi:flagellar L-ring protein precursor FlgH
MARMGELGANAYGRVEELGGDAVAAARHAAAPPRMAGVSNPSALAGDQARGMPHPTAAIVPDAAPNSLWRPNARGFFDDQRAQDVGDILTVNIQITDRAEVTNSSSRSRSGETQVGVNSFLGLEGLPGALLPGGYDPGSLIDAEGNTSSRGQGQINREEEIELTVAAVIIDILPNGNLVIAGRQQVLVNAELRELTVTGVIRPQDIAANNTIRHDQIAEARIAYGGRGQVSVVQRPALGQRVVDAVSPW